MSRSYRDKKAHKARNARKYFPESKDLGETLFREGVYPTKNFPKIAWSIQGKRRRNSSRKGNQKVKQMVHQIDRAKNKVETIKTIKTIV
jgi:hypothetical protein